MKSCYAEKPLVRAVIAWVDVLEHTSEKLKFNRKYYTVYNLDDILNDYWDFTRQWKDEGFTEVQCLSMYGTYCKAVLFIKKAAC